MKKSPPFNKAGIFFMTGIMEYGNGEKALLGV
jgi:hypothetical protein